MDLQSCKVTHEYEIILVQTVKNVIMWDLYHT